MEFLEIPLYDDDIFKLLVRFALNVFFLTLIVKYAVFPNQRQREFAFTAVMMNVTVFFICFALKKLELGIGMALGLFAIFGVLRYRTDSIRVKEMTYLFIVIGIAVINSLSNRKTSYAELMLVHFIIFGTALLKERVVGNSQSGKHSLIYDKLQLLGPQHRKELLADLSKRTGISVTRVEIQKIDLRKSNATLTIWHEGQRTGDRLTKKPAKKSDKKSANESTKTSTSGVKSNAPPNDPKTTKSIDHLTPENPEINESDQ